MSRKGQSGGIAQLGARISKSMPLLVVSYKSYLAYKFGRLQCFAMSATRLTKAVNLPNIAV